MLRERGEKQTLGPKLMNHMEKKKYKKECYQKMNTNF